METNILFCGLKKLGHGSLGQPDRFTFQANADARFPILGLVDQEFIGSIGKVTLHLAPPNPLSSNS
jgi:hypothetical protein